ncbi:hypothetical protein B566_EDAN004569 [Ephemera danica]|nr:hypothetical protein B566_EDAN004569 [Ephemera danica]
MTLACTGGVVSTVAAQGMHCIAPSTFLPVCLGQPCLKGISNTLSRTSTTCDDAAAATAALPLTFPTSSPAWERGRGAHHCWSPASCWSVRTTTVSVVSIYRNTVQALTLLLLLKLHTSHVQPGDSMGSIMAYDALCRSGQYQNRHDSDSSLLEPNNDGAMGEWGESESQHHQRHLSAPAPRRRSSSTSDHQSKLEFEVNDLFMFGSPLALVLAYRKVASTDDKSAPIPRPQVQQVYNLFHPTDPVAARIEPLISARFSMLPPVNIARYQKYPLGNGNPYHLLEFIQANPQLFTDTVATSPGCHLRRMSEISMQSIMSGINDTLPMHTITSCKARSIAMSQKWWGPKRLDYALYCPEGLANFPTNALPHLFHASYWESSDVIAFMVRQLGRLDPSAVLGRDDKEMASFNPGQPREKWLRKRTSVKLKNVAANHRANDVIVKEGAQQLLSVWSKSIPKYFKQQYVPGEKVDIHVMKDLPAGEWTLLSTEITDKNGRICYTIPDDKALSYGMYPCDCDNCKIDSLQPDAAAAAAGPVAGLFRRSRLALKFAGANRHKFIGIMWFSGMYFWLKMESKPAITPQAST